MSLFVMRMRIIKVVALCWAITQIQGCTPEASQRLKKVTEETKQGADDSLKAPSISAPTPLENGIKLEWSPVAGADSYLIYWSSYSGVTVSSETIEAVGSPYVHQGLDVKNTYYYRVGAVRGGKYGPLSEEVSASPFDPTQVVSDLLPATLVTATAVPNSETSLSISWVGDDRAESYNIYFANSPGVSKTSQVIVGATNPYQHNSLVKGAIYYYRVAGVKGGIPGPLSFEFSGVPQIQNSGDGGSTALLPPPSSLIAESAGAGNLQLTWSEVAGADSYNIYFNTFQVVDTRSSTVISNVTSPYMHSSLMPGTVYYYKVAAVKNNVVGRLSSLQIGAPEASSGGSGVPLPAPSLNSPVPGQNSMAISWTAVPGAGKYHVYFSESPNINTTQKFVSSLTTSITQANLTGGKTYYYKVAAAKIVNGFTEVGNLSNEVSGTAQKATVATPVFSTNSGFHPTKSSLTIALTSDTSGATIYYRLDGQNPVCGAPGSTIYSGPFPITTSMTIKAIACSRPSFNDSSIVTQEFIVNVVTCGFPIGCYDNTSAMNSGFAFLVGTTQLIEYKPANPSCTGANCFKIWKEYNGSKFLNATGIWKIGSSTWQKRLNSNGEGFKDEYAAAPAATQNFEGRRCPKNSFVQQGAQNVQRQCLYYEFSQQSALAIDNWDLPSSGDGIKKSFFEGNPSVCANKGMRIPTIWEAAITSSPIPLSQLPFSSSATFSGSSGIPSDASDSNKYFWTATSYGSGPTMFWSWSGNNKRGDDKSTQNYIRCVLPSEAILFCGQPGNGCYDNSVVMQSGIAYVGKGQEIELWRPMEGVNGVSSIWKEMGGNRILKANGIWSGDNDWQRKLDRPGLQFTQDYFENSIDISTLMGRSCMPNVFLNRADMTAENKCVYYDRGGDLQFFNTFPGVFAEDYLANWDGGASGAGRGASWYEGNVQPCSNKGMRLPTVYETSVSKPSGALAANLPIEAGVNPIFAGASGVPSLPNSVRTYTATACYDSRNVSQFFTYLGSGPSCLNATPNAVDPVAAVRCVLPSSEPNAKITQEPFAALYLDQPPSFSVQVQKGSDVDLSYQWQKSMDGGLMFVDLEGKTGSSITLDTVQGSDHNSLYRVLVMASFSGSSWSPLKIYSKPASLFVASRLVTCGDSVANGCYANSQATTEGMALLKDGTLIEYAQASEGFRVWKEYFGQKRVLPASGIWNDETSWQKKLIRSGEDFSSRTDGSQYFTDYQSIAGRVCPTSVFLNREMMTASNRCLYYDSGDTSKSLIGAQLGIEKEDWLSRHNTPGSGAGTSLSWYEGNVKFCADKGMRLPLIYETTATSLPPFVPLYPAVTLDGKGVPNLRVGIPSWTSSGQQELANYFMAWNGASTSVKTSITDTNDIRCVLP